MLRRRPAFRRTSPTSCLLETFPPIFHLSLTISLTYYAVIMNPYSKEWQLATAFVVGQILLNWGFFLTNRSSVATSTRNFPGYVHKFPSMDKEKRKSDEEEGRVPNAVKRSDWRECETCDMHVPTPTRHCGHCRKCILHLDHHCYFLGHCVGRNNMRYFIVFCTYAAIGCALGVYNLMQVMKFYRTFLSSEVGYYVLPYTIAMYFMKRAAGFEVFYVALINFGGGACGACLFLLAQSFYHLFSGTNPNDEKKKKKNINSVVMLDAPDLSKNPMDRFREVFGTFGLLHFLVPMVPFDGQPEPVVGYRRVITYNNDYVYNGMIHTSEHNLSNLK
jgi:hypothetical protein